MIYNSPIYEKRVVAFVDILGFKNMVVASQTDIIQQQRILQAMDIIHSHKKMNDEFLGGGLKEFGVQVTTFSDSAIISYPITYDGGLFFVLLDLIHLQLDLLKVGMFIRGGVCIGDAHHDAFNAFGPAIIEAYYLESQKAIYPRIILTQDTINQGIAYSPSHQNEYDINLLYSLVQMDSDGWVYLDYLKQYQELNNPGYDYYILMKKSRENLINNLNFYFNQARIYQKYVWLLNYWNKTLNPKNLIIPSMDDLDEAMNQSLFNEYVNMKITIDYPHK